MAKTRGGVLLRAWAREQGLRQVDIAERIETSQQAVSDLMRGEMRMPLELALRVQRATAIPVEAWTEEVDDAEGSGEHEAAPRTHEPAPGPAVAQR